MACARKLVALSLGCACLLATLAVLERFGADAVASDAVGQTSDGQASPAAARFLGSETGWDGLTPGFGDGFGSPGLGKGFGSGSGVGNGYGHEKQPGLPIPSPVFGLLGLSQIIFLFFYYFAVVSKYPPLEAPTHDNRARELQNLSPPAACPNISNPAICFTAWCCSHARMAHTFDKTGVANYWITLMAAFYFPCCTLWAGHAATDLDWKLGGAKPQDPCTSCCCALFCFPCSIAQDAMSLDYATGVETGCVGVRQLVGGPVFVGGAQHTGQPFMGQPFPSAPPQGQQFQGNAQLVSGQH